MLVSFAYNSDLSHDPYPTCLILHPGWRNHNGKLLLHTLNLNYLTDDEVNGLRMLIDPAFKLEYFENLEKKNPGIAQEFDTIITNAANANITSPQDFYHRAIKPFIKPRGYDPYRTYDLGNIRSPRILRSPQQMTGQIKMNTFGLTKPGGKGKDEQQIMSDLAMKKAQEDATGVKQLTPSEKGFIAKLRGKARELFEKYKKKFQYMKGPNSNNRGLNFPNNQKQPKDGNYPKFFDPNKRR